MLRAILRRPLVMQRLRSYSSKADSDFQKLTQQLLKPKGTLSPSRPSEDPPFEGWNMAAEEEDESESPMSTSGRTEQKEELIFKEVLGQVLSNNAGKQKKSTSSPGKKHTPLSDSILALFNKPEPTSSSNPRATRYNKPHNSPSISSSMDGLLQEPPQETLSPEQIARNEVTSKLTEPVLKHIDSLETNENVTAYFEDIIMSRFDPSQKTDPTKDLQIDPLSPVVSSDTVPHILEKCIYALSNDFKDKLGAIHLFEMSKHHSIQFFTEACSAEVYNQIIRIRWEDYRDSYSVVSLASEIAINAIQPTLETTELLSKIFRDAMDGSNGMSSSKLGMPLWTGQDIKRLDELNRYRTRFQSSWAAKPILRI